MYRLFFVLILLILTGSLLFSQTSKVGTTGAQFLKISASARAVGMGEAFTGLANDISAIHWNPAGLAHLNRREAIFLHSQWLASMQYDFAAISFPLESATSSIAFFTTFLTMPEERVRTVYYPQGTGETFQSVDFNLGFSYARKLTEKLSFGSNFKYIRQSIWRANGSTWAIDFGTLYQTDFHDLQIGLAISNFGPPIKLEGQTSSIFVDIDPDFQGNLPVRARLETEEWELPLAFRFGFAMNLLKTAQNRITIASDFTHPNDNNQYVNVGTEYTFQRLFSIRAGYRGLGLEELDGGLTFGGGFAFSPGETQIRFDYAFVHYGRLEATHRFALNVGF